MEMEKQTMIDSVMPSAAGLPSALRRDAGRADQAQDKGAALARFAALIDKDPVYDRKLKDTCMEMESLFVKQMLSVMRKTVPKTGLIDGGQAEKIFTDMLDDQYAMSISKQRPFGLADALYGQLTNGRKWA
jgi:Rod binding domain-containing protein